MGQYLKWLPKEVAMGSMVEVEYDDLTEFLV
jgi:hypothetical protein